MEYTFSLEPCTKTPLRKLHEPVKLSSSSLFRLLISDHRVWRPASRILIFRVVPLGVPSMTESHLSPWLNSIRGFRSGIILTVLMRVRMMVSSKVSKSNAAATQAVATIAPSFRSSRPHTPVAVAAKTNMPLCVTAHPALTRG